MAVRRLFTLAAVVMALAVAALASPSQASAACTAINFGAAPTADSIGAAAETDCYTFTGAADGEIRIKVVETGGTLITSTSVLRPNSSAVCSATTAAEFTCSLDAAGTHTINVADNTATKTGNYSIAIQRLNDPVGCTALTFGAAPTTASIGAAAEMDCYSFAGAVGDEIRFRAVRTSGSFSGVADIVRPNGTTVCGPSGAQELTCSIDAAGQHRVIFRDSIGTGTGNYAALVQRLNNPTGCTALTFGAAPTAAGIAAAGEWDCYSFAGAPGDQIRLRLLETSGSLTTSAELVALDGTTVCGPTTAAEFTCTLDSSGQHRLLVRDNNGANIGNYSVAVQRLNNPTGCTALTFGAAPTATSIAAVGEMDCFTYSGSPGRRVRIRVVKTSGALSPTQEVVDADGATLCNPTGSQDLTCVSEASGTHRVIVRDGVGTNTGDYSIAVQRLDSPTGCAALANGAAPTTAAIAAAGEMDCYEFTGAVGDRFRIRVTETSGGLVALQEVVRPNGSTVCAPTSAQDLTCVLNTAGTHRVLVEDNNGTNLGNYSVALRRLNTDAGCTALTFGAAPTAASIVAADEMDCYTFNGAAGGPVRIRVVKTSGTMTPIQEVVRANGSTLCTPNGVQDLTCTPDSSGTHRIILRDSLGTNLGDYVISVRRLNNDADCTPLTYGAAPTAAAISTAGEMDCFTFAGAPGDQIRVRFFETSGALVGLGEVVRATGTLLCGPTTAAEGTCPVDSGGTLRLIVRDNGGTNLGNYLVGVQRLNNPAGCTALTFGAAPTAGAITPGEMDCFTFNGTAGDQIRVRMVKTAGALSAAQEVVGPNGGTVCSPTGVQDGTCTLDTSGTHRILVDDNVGTNAGDYAIAVQSLGNPTGCTALTFGSAPTTANIGAAGEMDCFSFAAAPGDKVRVRLSEASGGLIALQEVVGPDGTTLCGATTAIQVPCVVESNGQHRLIVRDNGGTSLGDYVVAIQRLNPAVGCTPLTFGAAPTTASIGVAGEIDCYTFAGSAGDRIRMRMTKTSGTVSPTQELLRPSGGTLCSPTGTPDVSCTLGSSGTHTILVHDSSGNNTGNYSMAIQRLNNPTGCTALVIGAVATGASIVANGEMDCFTFTATAGQKVTVHVTETSGTLVAQQEILRISGGTLAGPSTAADQPATAKGAGTYKIVVQDSLGTRLGNYSISVTSP